MVKETFTWETSNSQVKRHFSKTNLTDKTYLGIPELRIRFEFEVQGKVQELERENRG